MEITTPQTSSWMVRDVTPPHVSSRLISAHSLQNEVYDRARDNGFPGPAVALDGPDYDNTNSEVNNRVNMFISQFFFFRSAHLTTSTVCPCHTIKSLGPL